MAPWRAGSATIYLRSVMTPHRWPLALALALFVVASGAFAGDPSPDDAARAHDLKTQGDAAMDALHYDEALKDYAASYALSHDPAILYNVGQVRRARGDYPEALDSLEAFAREAPPALKARVPRLDELIAEVRAKVATLAITTNVSGARVLVRERVVGTTPLAKPLRLAAGKASVEIDADGYLPYRRQLDLAGGGTTVIDAKLDAKNTHGVLVIQTKPGGGTVFVDGTREGTAPIEVTVTAGSHKVVVQRDGYEDAESAAVVAAGARHELDVPLVARSSIATRWWFWTGIAVVVAGGAALTVALLTPRSPDSGDGFTPGQVGAPLRW